MTLCSLQMRNRGTEGMFTLPQGIHLEIRTRIPSQVPELRSLAKPSMLRFRRKGHCQIPQMP